MLTSDSLFEFLRFTVPVDCGLRRAIFSSGVSKRSEGKASQRFSNTRNRYRVSSSPDCAVKPANQRTHRAFQDAQEGQSLAPRAVEDGLSAPELAGLLEDIRHSAVSRSSRPARTAPVNWSS